LAFVQNQRTHSRLLNVVKGFLYDGVSDHLLAELLDELFADFVKERTHRAFTRHLALIQERRNHSVARQLFRFREYIISSLRTRTSDPAHEISLTVSAAEAPMMLRISGSFWPSALSTMLCTCTSLNQPFGNKGRMGRSVSRLVRISFSVGRPSRLK